MNAISILTAVVIGLALYISIGLFGASFSDLYNTFGISIIVKVEAILIIFLATVLAINHARKLLSK